MRRYRRRKQKQRARLLAILMAAAALGIIWRINAHFRPVLEQVAINTCQYQATMAIEQCIQQEMSRGEESYDTLVTLEKDDQQQVTAVLTDVAAMNRFKSQLVSTIYEEIRSLEDEELSIALGTLLQGDWLAQRGPRIPLRIIGLGVAKADFVSVFSSAGVNQTKHQILLEITVDLTVLFPGGNETTQVTSQFPLAETIVLGDVPDSYTYIDDTESSLLGKINDYATNDAPSSAE